MLIAFARDDRLDIQCQQILVDPVGTIGFVAGKLNGPCHGFAVVVGEAFVRSFQERLEAGGFVILPGSQMKVQRMAVGVAQQVNLR